MTVVENYGSPIDQSVAGFAADVDRGNLPVVPEALRGLLRVRSQLVALQLEAPVVEQPGQVLWNIGQEVLASGELPEDYAERVHEAETRQGLASVRARTLDQLSRMLSDRVPMVVAEHIDEILTGLRDQLLPVVEKLRSAYAVLGDGFDLDNPDAMEVAGAGDAVREALLAVVESSKDYRRIRRVQFTVHKISGQPPGDDGYRLHSWADVAADGILELRDLDTPGLPTDERGKRSAVRAIVSRPDVWLPSSDQLEDAWYRIHGHGAAVGVQRPGQHVDRPPRGTITIGE